MPAKNCRFYAGLYYHLFVTVEAAYYIQARFNAVHPNFTIIFHIRTVRYDFAIPPDSAPPAQVVNFF